MRYALPDQGDAVRHRRAGLPRMTAPGLAPYEQQWIQDSVTLALSHLERAEDRLPADLLFSRDDHPWPLWLLLCQTVFVGGKLCTPEERVRLWHRFRSEQAIPSVPAMAELGPPTGTQRPLSAARVAELAALCGGVPGVDAPPPADLTEDMLQHSLAGQMERGPPDLDLTQLLVQGKPGLLDKGRLARLEFHRVPVELLRRSEDFGALVRSPGAALLPVDTDFALGLDQVQALLRRVLVEGSPAIAWNLRPLPEEGHTNAPALPAVSGSSATAALAYGALYLLREHLRPEFVELAAWFDDIEHPNAVTITASMESLHADGSTWPRLLRVEGIDDKVGVRRRVPVGRLVPHCYVAADQHANALRLDAQPVGTLADLIEQIGRDCGSQMDDDARRLHRLLVHDDEPINDETLLDRVADASARPASLKAYLVQRYARRASGPRRAFGDPLRLDQHFVRMVLQTEIDPGDDDRGLGGLRENANPREIVELRHLLHAPEFSRVPAWCIDAPPFSGKTTLLAAWEMGTARRALQRWQSERAWGEVCIFLPMLSFHPTRRADPAEQRTAVIDEFKCFIDQQAPGLPLIDEILAGKAETQGLKLRLLVDALNEIPSVNLDHRREVMRILCTWMSQQRRVLLPPVFTVRTLENGLSLVSDTDPAWHARRAKVLPWLRSDWRAYIAQRKLHERASDKLLKALRADLPDGASRTAFEEFCSTPGILSAQCTLLQRWSDLTPLDRPGTLFLALLWHRIDTIETRGLKISSDLLPQHMLQQAPEAVRRGLWHLPRDPGVLLQQLTAQADAMYDAGGQPVLEVPTSDVPPGLRGEDAGRWLEAVRQLGLGEVRFGPNFAFVHQQWLAFFAALALRVEGSLPDVTPPPLWPPDEASLFRHLEEAVALLEPPAVTPHHERVRFAVGLSSDPVRWIERLLPYNLALAAQVAIDQREVLEPRREDRPGLWHAPHPVLQHLRRALLLRSVDAGATVRDRVRASGLIEALEQPVQGLPQPFRDHWDQEWRTAFRAGRDVRERMQAGLLLGDLGDNVRYEWVQVRLEDGTDHSGVRLRHRHWIAVGTPGEKTWFRIGSDEGAPWAEGNETPAFDVELDYFEMAAYPVTMAEWTAFVDGGGYDDPGAPWWRAAGSGAQEWLALRMQANPSAEIGPSGWGRLGDKNTLMPACGLTAFEATAYASWASWLYDDWEGGGRVAVPTEIMWEGGVRGPARHGCSQASWPHIAGFEVPQELKLSCPWRSWTTESPIGVFSAGLTEHGISDASGGCAEWCSSRVVDKERLRGWRGGQARRLAMEAANAEGPYALRPLRGSWLPGNARLSRVASRHFEVASRSGHYYGLRLVRCTDYRVLPDSGR